MSFDAVPSPKAHAPCSRARCRCNCANPSRPPRPSATRKGSAPPAAAANLGPDAQARFYGTQGLARRSGPRTQPARLRDLHDATLAAIAERNPASLDDLQGISGHTGARSWKHMVPKCSGCVRQRPNVKQAPTMKRGAASSALRLKNSTLRARKPSRRPVARQPSTAFSALLNVWLGRITASSLAASGR